jgi:hypothetical protein
MCDANFAGLQDLIDVLEGNRIYTPAIYVLNKIDSISLEELELLGEMPNYCPVSSHKEWNLDRTFFLLFITALCLPHIPITLFKYLSLFLHLNLYFFICISFCLSPTRKGA